MDMAKYIGEATAYDKKLMLERKEPHDRFIIVDGKEVVWKMRRRNAANMAKASRREALNGIIHGKAGNDYEQQKNRIWQGCDNRAC